MSIADPRLQTLVQLTVAGFIVSCTAWLCIPTAKSETTENARTGAAIYNFYCYQCHGYSGDASTLASTYLKPRPRNFTHADAQQLTQARMVSAVTHGRPGTAMVSFSKVLEAQEIEAVVGYIRDNYMSGNTTRIPYHSKTAGWANHDRYASAYAFATGSMSLDTPWEALDAIERRGKRLFLSACISCHDRPQAHADDPPWELHASSHLSEYGGHDASHEEDYDDEWPYRLHNAPPEAEGLNGPELRGKQHFEKNCVYCHAADGTGRNWIGGFMLPNPPDLNHLRINAQNLQKLKSTIEVGIAGTSMPGWRHVLGEREIDETIAYLVRVFGVDGSEIQRFSSAGDIQHQQLPRWQRVKKH